MQIRIVTIFGTRPEAIKMAPLVKELQQHPDDFQVKVAVTAQHRQMLDQVLQLFNIIPDYDLDIMQAGQSLSDITVRALSGLNQVLDKENPDIVLVHGDTTTTFVGALAAFYKQIPVGHVEAGLRTHDKYSPYPEEMNRQLTGVLASVHFAPTATSRQNLLGEGVNPEAIYVTGNTVIDALHQTAKPDYAFAEADLERIDFANKRIILMTTHRRENLGEPMRAIYRALLRILKEFSDTEVVFPVHKNPQVRSVVDELLGSHPRVHLVEPMDYEPFINLMNRAHLILTDSGGIQEEAPSLGKPVLVVRDLTERPEAVKSGTVRIAGTQEGPVYGHMKELLSNTAAYKKMAGAINPYGDGQASRRIAFGIKHYFGHTDIRPEEWRWQE